MVTSQGSDPGVNRRVDDALMSHVLYCMPYFPCHACVVHSKQIPNDFPIIFLSFTGNEWDSSFGVNLISFLSFFPPKKWFISFTRLNPFWFVSSVGI